MKHGSLFSGIGGFDLAAEWMGWENVFHCEINEFGRKILKQYWPEAISYEDITKTDFTIHRGDIDILTGGFPCQPFSVAGKRKGTADERHLWPEMLRAIREIQPRWIVGENVRGIISWDGGMVFDQVQADLEFEGYQVLPFLLPACAVNSPHRRDRVWFIAYSESNKNKRWRQGGFWPEFAGVDVKGAASNPKNTGLQTCFIGQGEKQFVGGDGPMGEGQWNRFPTQSPVCGGNDGLPTKLDGITIPKWRRESIKAYGNAIVPQVALQIFKAIEQYEKLSIMT